MGTNHPLVGYIVTGFRGHRPKSQRSAPLVSTQGNLKAKRKPSAQGIRAAASEGKEGSCIFSP